MCRKKKYWLLPFSYTTKKLIAKIVCYARRHFFCIKITCICITGLFELQLRNQAKKIVFFVF